MTEGLNSAAGDAAEDAISGSVSFPVRNPPARGL